MLFWIVLAAVAGAVCFIGCGYAIARVTEMEKKKQITTAHLVAIGCGTVGILLFGVSLWHMRGISLGKVGTPDCLDERIFYRVIGDLQTLSGKNIIGIQDAAENPYSIKSDCRAPRGTFLKLVKTPTGKRDLEPVDVNRPSS